MKLLLQWLAKSKVSGWIALHPKQDWCSHGGWFTQGQWIGSLLLFDQKRFYM
jgi:hypothetical protein